MIKNAVAKLIAMFTCYGAPNYQLHPYLQTILGKAPHRGNETDPTLSLHASVLYKSWQGLDRKHCRRNSVGENLADAEVRGLKFQPGLSQICRTLRGSGSLSV